MADREFVLKIVGDVTSAQKGLDTLSSDTEKASGKMSGAFKLVAGAVSAVAIVEFGKSVVSAASDQEQAVGALNSVFKEYSDQMNDFGKTTAENLGISRAEFSQLAAVTGSMLKNAGVPMDEVASSTQSLTERAADLAAMYGGTVPDAMNAINSALKGEMDPLEQYAVSLKASAIEAKAVAMGLVDAEGKATDYGKAMATQALIMEQSADAAGTFAKESGTVAGQTERMKAQFADLQADLGKKLLPILVKVAETLRGLLTFVVNNQGWLIPLVAAIGGIVLAVKAWQVAQVAWTVATQAAAAAQVVFNAAMAMNPIGLIIIAITALIAGFVLLYTKVDWFREGVDAMVDGVVAGFNWILDMVKSVFDWVKTNWPLLLAILTGPFGVAVLLITKNWDTVKDAARVAIDTVRNIVAAVTEFITRPFRDAYAWVKGIIDGIPGVFRSMVSGVSSALSTIWQTMTDPFRRAWESVKGIWDGAGSIFTNIVTGIKNAFWGLADVLKAPFTTAFTAIKNFWNSTVGGFGFSVPSWIPGVGGKSFKIPMMAAGGIVTRPTIALIGEAGPEAVVPLGRGGAVGGVTINVYALTASAEVGRQVWNSLREYERTTGKAIA